MDSTIGSVESLKQKVALYTSKLRNMVKDYYNFSDVLIRAEIHKKRMDCIIELCNILHIKKRVQTKNKKTTWQI